MLFACYERSFGADWACYMLDSGYADSIDYIRTDTRGATAQGERTMALGTTRIAERSLGTREIRNTNHGVTAYVERFQSMRGVESTVAVVCNGIADYSETFKTRRAAMAAYAAL
jgi:hypothetical protein